MQTPIDRNMELMLDANGVAGALEEIFGRDVTACETSCSYCGRTAPLGSLEAFTQAPGVVLRCVLCEHIVLRFARTPHGLYVDLRGISCLRLGG